jgi:syntaxin 7
MSFADIEKGGSGRPAQSRTAYQAPPAPSGTEAVNEQVADYVRRMHVNIGKLERERNKDRLHKLIDETKGISHDASDAIKQSRGKVSGRVEREFEGALERFKGAAQRAIERIKRETADARSSGLSPPRADESTSLLGAKAGRSGAAQGGGLENYSSSNNNNNNNNSAWGYQTQTQEKDWSEEVRLNETIIKERDAELADLESAIVDVNQITKDLADLVHKQGEQLDLIENHLVKTNNYTEKATGELRKANEYQKAARKKMCIILLMVAVVVGVGIFFLVKMTGGNSM